MFTFYKSEIRFIVLLGGNIKHSGNKNKFIEMKTLKQNYVYYNIKNQYTL